MQPTNIFWQLFHHGAHISKEHHIPLKDHAFRGFPGISWGNPVERFTDNGSSLRDDTTNLCRRRKVDIFLGSFASLDWYQWYLMVSNGIQWSYRRDWHLASFLQAEAPGRIRSNFSWSAKLIRVYRIYAESMPLCFPVFMLAGPMPLAALWSPEHLEVENTLRANLEWGFWPKRTMMQVLTTRLLAGALWCRANRTRMFATVKYLDIQESPRPSCDAILGSFWRLIQQHGSTWIINWANIKWHIG